VTGRTALGQGLAAARAGWRLVVWAWALDLLVAAVMALPFVLALDAATAHGGGAALARRFDDRLFTELAASQPALYAHWDLKLALGVAAAVVLHGFLAGGLIAGLTRRGARGEARPSAGRDFFAACMAHAGSTIGVSLVAGVALALVGGLLHGLLAGRLEGALRDVASERTRLLVTLAPGAFYLVVIAVVATWADLARARAVLAGDSLTAALGRGARLLGRRPGALLVIGLGGLALQVGARVVFVGIDGAVPQGGWGGILLVVAAGQLLLLWRHGVRVAVVAATARLCRWELGAGTAPAPRIAAPVRGEVAAPDPPC
jgi:hypothetical protein